MIAVASHWNSSSQWKVCCYFFFPHMMSFYMAWDISCPFISCWYPCEVTTNMDTQKQKKTWTFGNWTSQSWSAVITPLWILPCHKWTLCNVAILSFSYRYPNLQKRISFFLSKAAIRHWSYHPWLLFTPQHETIFPAFQNTLNWVQHHALDLKNCQ